MKLSEFLIDVGRPIAYYPGLRKLTGSTNATIFLCQFVYWTGKESAGDGWIYKTAENIEEETGLSYKEQLSARKKLVSGGLLSERYARLEHVMYFKVDLEALNSKWDPDNQPEVPEPDQSEASEHMPNEHMANCPKVSSSNSPSCSSLIGSTETTREYPQGAENQAPGVGSLNPEKKPQAALSPEEAVRRRMDDALGLFFRVPKHQPKIRMFIEETGLFPRERDVSGYIEACRQLDELRALPPAIKEAVKRLKQKGSIIKDMFSVIGTVGAVIGEKRLEILKKQKAEEFNRQFQESRQLGQEPA